MALSRQDVEDALATCDPEALEAILIAAEVTVRTTETPRALAEQVTRALWWNYSTPLGYYADRASLEDITLHVARRLGVKQRIDADRSGWEQLQQLTHALLDTLPTGGVALDDLSPRQRRKLARSPWQALGLSGGAVSSFGARWLSGVTVRFFQGPIGRWLPLLPTVGPWAKLIQRGAGGVHLVAGPVGIGLAVLSLNSALGADYHKLVPLLLGVGALGPSNANAEESSDAPSEHHADTTEDSEEAAADSFAGTDDSVAAVDDSADNVDDPGDLSVDAPTATDTEPVEGPATEASEDDEEPSGDHAVDTPASIDTSVLELSVAKLTAALAGGAHDADLPALIEAEQDGKNRKTAVAALEARLETLGAGPADASS